MNSFYTAPVRPLDSVPGAPSVEITYRYPSRKEMFAYLQDSMAQAERFPPPPPNQKPTPAQRLAFFTDDQEMCSRHAAGLVAALKVDGQTVAAQPDQIREYMDADARFVWMLHEDSEWLFRLTTRGGAGRTGGDRRARDVQPEGGGAASEGSAGNGDRPESGPAPVPELPAERA